MACNTGVICVTCVNFVATEVGVFNKPGREIDVYVSYAMYTDENYLILT